MLVKYVIACLLFTQSSVLFSAEAMSSLPDQALKAEQKGDLQRAVSIYMMMVLKQPDNAEIWMKVAKIEYQLKDYNLAIDATQHALRLRPKDDSIYKYLSQLYAETNKPDLALSALNEAIKLKPNDYTYLVTRGQLANWNKNPALALQSYIQALGLIESQQNTTQQLELLIEIGSLQNQLRDYKSAITTYNKAIVINPYNASFYQFLAQTFAANNDAENAMKNIDKALQLEPDNIHFLEAKAIYASWLKHPEVAAVTWQRILKLDPYNKEALQQVKAKSSKSTDSILQVHEAALMQAKNIKPYDELVNLSNEQAFRHEYNLAANTIKRLLKRNPGRADLYKKLSEIYATANNPQQAFWAITLAVKYDPNNLKYWRDRAKLGAWADQKQEVQKSYERILQLKPYDQDAMLQLAHTLAWRGLTDEAIVAYKALLKAHPQTAEGWIQYANVASWVEAYRVSLNALAHYSSLEGNNKKYLETTARVLALTGWYKSSLAINDPLLQKYPSDNYVLVTQVNALPKALEIKRAVSYLAMLDKKSADDPIVKGLKNIVLTPLRSNINLGANYTAATDTTRIAHIPVLNMQYFLSPATSLLLQGFYERASAAPGSFLTPVTGGTTIGDENLMVGFSTQYASLFNLTAYVGGLKIEGENQHGIYDALVNTNLNEKLQLTFDSSYNLYRPYLVPQSPKLISLQIMEKRNGVLLQWQPFVQTYFNAVVSYSDLSDFNGYWHTNLWPKARVFSSQYWQVSLGANADLWRYKRRANDGYFSPLQFDGYEGTIDVYHSFSENIGCTLSGGFGMQKDETFPHYFYEEDLAAQLFLGIFTDWELKVNGAYTLRKNPDGAYQSWTTGLTLTRRY